MLMGQQNNLELLYQWSSDELVGSEEYDNTYNEVWGFVQNNREFAVIGSTEGTHIFDVTEPANSYLVTSISGAATGPDIIHRDYHTYNGYLYAVCDENTYNGQTLIKSTLQIIDLSNLPNSAELIYDSNDIITRAHNIFIDEENAMMYVCVGEVNNQYNRLSILSLENPENPVFLQSYSSYGEIHDVYVKNNIAYLNAGWDSRFYIVDFSNINSPQTLGVFDNYTDPGYNHSGWLTEDGNTYVFADENHGSKIKICDVSNPSEIDEKATLLSDVDSTSIAHNLIIKNNLLYVSHYYDGLWIWDISDPENPTYVASYDTYPLENGNSYKGAWGVYPLLPSGNILVSDMQYGLFVFKEIESSIKINEYNNSTIFPNPCNDHLTIQINSDKQKIIQLYDMYGKIILSKKTNSHQIKIELDQLINPGIYILKVIGDETSDEHRIIKS